MNSKVRTSISEILKYAIDSDYKKLRDSFQSDSYYAIQILIRRFDVISIFFWNSKHQSEEKLNESREFFNFGWAPLMKLFLKDHHFSSPSSFILTTQRDYDWADSVLLHAGRLEFCRQLLVYEKAGFLKFINPRENEFELKYKSDKTSIEYFERASFDFFRNEVVERIINNRKSELFFDYDDIKKKLREIIKNPYGKLISYVTTPEISEYYDREGQYHILKIQGYDDFSPSDTFGSIEYSKYVNLIEMIAGAAIMHIDACLELIKMNSEVDMHNILTYFYYKDETIKTFSKCLGASYEEIEQILSCLTVNKDNYEYYLDITASAPPIYFQIADNQLIRSIAGCLGNPFRILNNELKRKFKKDYDVAVNKREERFRQELFLFFPQERIIKIPNEVKISFNGIKTDVDAIIYDSTTKTLGLFQLKWQDIFAHSMKERFSRLTNLFPKVNEWINKIEIWLSHNDEKSILNALQITKYMPHAKEIKDVYVFVLGRNHIHFSEVKTDERVAWGSWYQLIEAMAKIEAKFDNPIKEMFVRLKTFAPEQRIKREEMPIRQNFDVKISDYRIYYNEKN